MSVGVYVRLSLMSMISPPHDLYVGTLLFLFRSELRFLNCDDVCMRVFDESLQLLEFVVYADLQNVEISLVIAARSVNACGVCSVCSPTPSHVKIWINPVHVLLLCG